jgi:hypothetical protein
MEFDDLAARAAIADTIATYCHAGDSGRIDEFLSCFAADGVLETKGRTSRGSTEIAAFVREIGVAFSSDPAFLPARHHVASVWVRLLSPDEALAGAYFALFAANGLDHWGTYRDRFVLTKGRWCFAHRRVRLEGARDGSPVGWLVE